METGKKYILFLRGINISGKNKIEMPILKTELEKAGFLQVSTYLNSGNVSLFSDEHRILRQAEPGWLF